MKKYLIATALLTSLFGCSPGQKNNALPNQDSGNRPTGNTVTLNWNSNRGEQQGFDIEESTDGTNFTQVMQVPDGTNTATITIATPGQNYSFRIRGYNQAGTSPYTSVVTAALATK